MDRRYSLHRDVFVLLRQYHQHDRENHEKEQVNKQQLGNHIYKRIEFYLKEVRE